MKTYEQLNFWQKLFKKPSSLAASDINTREDLQAVIKHVYDQKLVDFEARDMFEGVLHVSEMQVRDIMVPRSQMVVVEEGAPIEQLLNTVVDSGHSRFPLVGEDRDKVLGIFLAKDLLRSFAENGAKPFDMSKYLRPPMYVPESKRLNVLLKEFRQGQNHMAIVVDEYGGVAGLITMEDVIEQIIGDIDDEHDVDEESPIKEEQDGSFTVSAIVRIEEFNEQVGAKLNDDEYDTVAGLIIQSLGRLPRRNEVVTMSGYEFKVLRTTKRRIEVVNVKKLPKAKV